MSGDISDDCRGASWLHRLAQVSSDEGSSLLLVIVAADPAPLLEGRRGERRLLAFNYQLADEAEGYTGHQAGDEDKIHLLERRTSVGLAKVLNSYTVEDVEEDEPEVGADVLVDREDEGEGSQHHTADYTRLLCERDKQDRRGERDAGEDQPKGRVGHKGLQTTQRQVHEHRRKNEPSLKRG